jgi:adenylate cyclase
MPKDLKKGIEYFEQALEKDSNYALAYAGLADSYTILGDYNILPPKTTYPKAIEAATRALEIDNQLAEAHTSLAYAQMHYTWDWSGAEKEFKKAITLNPNYSLARAWYALFLTARGQFDEAISVRKKAQELDPLSPAILADAGLTLYFSRQYDDAILQFQKALEKDPSFVLAYIPLGGAYVQKKMYTEATKAFQTVSVASTFVTSTSHPIPLAALAHVYAVSGRRDDAITMFDLLMEKSREEYVAPSLIGAVHTGLGNTAQALEWLEKAYEQHDGLLIFLNVDPIFDPLRSEPRFMALLQRLGFYTSS